MKLFNKDLRVVEYSVAVILCLVSLFVVLELWRADLSIPFAYHTDGLQISMYIKSLVDTGWYFKNGLIGMPTGLYIQEFPSTDNLSFLLMKFIALFSSDYAFIMNSYFLLTFPLTTISSLFVFRRFNVSYATSLIWSLLFTFLPYHFLRGEYHLSLSAYYMIPLMVMLSLLIFSDGAILFKPDKEPGTLRLNLRAPMFTGAILVCVVTGASAIYYAFFGCFFLFISGIAATVQKKRFYPLLAAGGLIAIISVTALIGIAPSIIYKYKHGKNPEAGQRSAVEAEIYGLKIAQMILPVAGHRIPYLAGLKDEYNSAPFRPLVNENNMSSLGAMGSLGFFILLAWLFSRNRKTYNAELKENLSFLNASAVLLATIGGLSSLFALIISPQIRAYNRISVYVAFFSFFAVALLYDEYISKYLKKYPGIIVSSLLAGCVLVVGISDQTTTHMVPKYSSIKASYINDAEFINRVEASVPENARIFQLPYARYPEGGPVYKMMDYEHFKGYLHSKKIAWSYGAMYGRDGDKWQKMVTSLPVLEFIETILDRDFNGLYIDRSGYEDMGVSIEKELINILNVKPLVSKDNRRFFFNLGAYKSDKTVLKQYTSARVRKNLCAGSVDIFERASFLSEGFLNVAGWAYDPDTMKSVKFVLILDNGTPFISVPVHILRPDVVTALNNKNLSAAGWQRFFSLKKLGRGRHRLEFLAALSDGSFAPLQKTDTKKYFIDIEVPL